MPEKQTAHNRKVMKPISDFFSSPIAGGIVLIMSSLAAIIVANSSLSEGYESLLKYKMVGLSVDHWVNDAMMAVFFMMLGLEIKRELITGQLATWSQRSLPGFAALGGMAVPALIYVGFNAGNDETLSGWAGLGWAGLGCAMRTGQWLR